MVNHEFEMKQSDILDKTLGEILTSVLRPVIREILQQERSLTEKKVRYYTREEVCEKLSICKATFHNWKNTGKLPVVKIGARVYVDADALDLALQDGEIENFKTSYNENDES